MEISRRGFLRSVGAAGAAFCLGSTLTVGLVGKIHDVYGLVKKNYDLMELSEPETTKYSKELEIKFVEESKIEVVKVDVNVTEISLEDGKIETSIEYIKYPTKKSAGFKIEDSLLDGLRNRYDTLCRLYLKDEESMMSSTDYSESCNTASDLNNHERAISNSEYEKFLDVLLNSGELEKSGKKKIKTRFGIENLLENLIE